MIYWYPKGLEQFVLVFQKSVELVKALLDYGSSAQTEMAAVTFFQAVETVTFPSKHPDIKDTVER